MKFTAAIAGALALAACAPAAAPAVTDAAAMPPTLFVANKRGNTLSKVDLATGEEVKRLPSCTNPSRHCLAQEWADLRDGRGAAGDR